MDEYRNESISDGNNEESKFKISSIIDQNDNIDLKKSFPTACNSRVVIKTENENINNGSHSTVFKQELCQYECDLLTHLDSIHYIKTETDQDLEQEYIVNRLKDENGKVSHTEDFSETRDSHLAIKTEREDLNMGNISTICKREPTQIECELLSSIQSIHYVKMETSQDFEREYVINQIKENFSGTENVQLVEKKGIEDNIGTTSCTNRKKEEIFKLLPSKRNQHESYQSNNHKCNQCDYTASNKTKIQAHINSIHLKLKPYKCELCEYTSSKKGRLQEHINSVHLKLRPHKCNLCDYSSSKKGKIQDHINSVHLKLKIHECDLCKYSSSVKRYLQRHINSAHLKLKPHKCDLCEYTSSVKTHLQIHIDSVHSKLRPHKCSLCEYSSSYKKHLQMHINSVHLKLRPHKCNFCDYSSSHKTNIRVHMNSVHLKLGIHKCNLCEYSSSIKRSLQRHINSIHLKLKQITVHTENGTSGST